MRSDAIVTETEEGAANELKVDVDYFYQGSGRSLLVEPVQLWLDGS